MKKIYSIIIIAIIIVGYAKYEHYRYTRPIITVMDDKISAEMKGANWKRLPDVKSDETAYTIINSEEKAVSSLLATKIVSYSSIYAYGGSNSEMAEVNNGYLIKYNESYLPSGCSDSNPRELTIFVNKNGNIVPYSTQNKIGFLWYAIERKWFGSGCMNDN